jgi:hypothetical protein
MATAILKILLAMALVMGINLTFQDARSRRSLRNMYNFQQQADSVLFHRYDSLVTTIKK